ELELRGRKAEVHDLEPLLDREAEAGEQDGPTSTEPAAEDPDADELALRRQRADDSRARGAVTDHVDCVVLVYGSVLGDDVSLLYGTDARVTGLDAAVEDADTHALARRAAPGPFPREHFGPAE